MELPDIVRESLGEEDVVAGVRLGDEDMVVFTPTRTVLYRGEGLLSDEGVSTFPFDFERLHADRGRRKTAFSMTYIDDERDFSVPNNRGDTVLERLIEGSLRVAGVVTDDEAVTGVFRFSELTLVVTEGRLLKHVGGYTWDSDFEVFSYDDLTKLDFEDGSVATQVVLGTDGRTERIKAPNQQAGAVRKALQRAVFDHHDVGSLDALNRKIEPEDTEEETDAEAGLGLDSGIDPLVQDSNEGSAEGAQPAAGGANSSPQETNTPSAGNAAGNATASPDARPSDTPEQTTASGGGGAGPSGREAGSAGGNAGPAGGNAGSADAAEEEFAWPREETGSASVDAGGSGDLQAVTDQLDELTQAVERQNEMLYRQQQTVQKLIEELKQGR